ncbi:hypothetical protein A2V71_03050 [Candidatus Berkelbacteria bacterium RBG_13_40_8]|uniref:Recombinase domain-containing protein n=1 Tax=Candidatus Berkelbacteria bacterium RBG_13_40_8 TaxID=1797467 RepID=A0A1F5DP95_9BACT|nr:MAG: hypothetical protein A2V71_03050 [Candidatus Berkelbacteria bacterium RBG_13_40_8]
MEPTGVQFSKTSPFLLPEDQDGKPIQGQEKVKSAVKYCLYARKSSEDDERQALSIDSQIKEMQNQARMQGLQVVEIRTESHSAKSTGLRPVFNQLIADIRADVFQGILSWAPDRLSRNAGDLGSIVDLMDNGYLREIRTHGQIFTNSPNDKFLLMILCSQAKLENDNRGVNVKRGMKTKCEMGYRPHLTPLGYLNDKLNLKGQKKIYQDPERAPIIKKAFEKIAYEGYSGRKIYLWLKNEVNFRTRSGKPATLSMVYRMFDNPYYTGIFETPAGSGKWYKGAYEPIIPKELFKLAQEKMIVPPKSMPGTKEFLFTKMIRCRTCSSGITAREIIKKSGQRYVYYYCTRHKDFTCHEPYISEEKLSLEFIRVLDQLTIDQLKAQKEMYFKFEQYRKFRTEVLDIELKENEVNEISTEIISLKKFIEHIFEKGSKEEKRGLAHCLNTTFHLGNKQIIID